MVVFPDKGPRLSHLKTGGIIMNKKWITIIETGVLLPGLVFAGASFAKSDNSEVRGGTIRIEKQAEADFPAMAKITLNQAVTEAMGAVQGQVLKTKLEDENGFLIYGVEVVTADKAIVDVKVDAGSGKVLAMSRDKSDDKYHESGGRDRDRDEADDEDHESGEHGRDRDRED
jgi:hypothetical protein